MATFSSNLMNQPAPWAEFPVTVAGTVTIPNGTALAANDVIDLVKLSPNSVVVDYKILVPDLDSGGTPTLSLTLKTSGNTITFVSNSTVGRSGGQLNYDMTNLTDVPKLSSAETLRFVVSNAAAGAIGADAKIIFVVTVAPTLV